MASDEGSAAEGRRGRWVEWGAAIRRCREVAASSREQLARRVGVSADTVRLWESGHRGPGLAARQKLCAELGIPPYLLDADGEHCPRCGRPWHI